MAKEKKQGHNEQDFLRQQEENEKLRARLAELEAEKQQKIEAMPPAQRNNYLNEMEEIRKKGKSQTGHIQYKDIHDHVNIALYHLNGLHIGKRVGPIHPENAQQTFNEFAKVGITLSIKAPSAEAIAVYKNTDEFKKLKDAFDKKRANKTKSKSKDAIERLTGIIAKQQGIDPDKLNSIRSPEEVGVSV